MTQIGDFLGDIGRGPEEEAWYNAIRKEYMAGVCVCLPHTIGVRSVAIPSVCVCV